MSPSQRARVLAAVAVALVAAAALLVSPAAALARVHALLTSPWFPLVLVALYAIRPLFAWPITVLSALCGYRYGLAVGLPLALCGAVATSLLPYYAGRRLPADADGLLGRLTAGSTAYFERTGGVRGVAAARLVPTPAEAVSGAAGAGGVPVRAFALGTLLGELPWTVAAVALGAGLDRFVVSAVDVDPRLVVVIAAVGVLVVVGPAYAWWRER
ncbi:putative membrane protein YdjX (TVP38/TMEM64 family) [Halarchaeum rubridurum]|uniref:Putative membrane protein YdjX (TVP38/TMEM64 family) n=1 Tax=Halarchaeum rubridurum TaxID=489911 RepID=A0A830FT50_9EURY|nr:VTT domain-containing protein [Halarchaeum rubridurum]MBP1953940.1 putative membrane protein YdjX (TVP38/TMEM64 family) [Halarchaeum rubridurum]GGM56033.1 TVP38/TMEM64 family protein [Halarchaeum rubridurum]